jgi:hypothetical protein
MDAVNGIFKSTADFPGGMEVVSEAQTGRRVLTKQPDYTREGEPKEEVHRH